MGILNQNIDEDLDRRFREEVAKKFGWKKGNLKRALEEAIEQWLSSESKHRKS